MDETTFPVASCEIIIIITTTIMMIIKQQQQQHQQQQTTAAAALKGAIPDSLQSSHCAADRTLKWPGRNRAQITCNTSGGHHVQHIGRSSRATHRAVITCNTSGRSSRATHRAVITCNTSGGHHVQHVVCHGVLRDCSAIKFDRA